MNLKIIEPIGQSEAAIRSRFRDLLETGSHRLSICDTRGLTEAALIQKVSDADVLLLSNRPLSREVIEAPVLHHHQHYVFDPVHAAPVLARDTSLLGCGIAREPSRTS